MALDTYANLKLTILDHIGGRADVTDATASDFVSLAEGVIGRRLRTRDMIARASATISDEYSAVPTGFAGPRSFVLTDTSPRTTLEWVSPQTMADLKGTWDQTSGTPNKYTVVGGEFEFGPVPSGSNTASLTYFQTIPALATNSTNWLLTKWPDLYLYGSLIQAGPYLIDDPRLPVWTGLFEQGLADAQAMDRQETTGSQLRVGNTLPSGL